MSPSEEFKQKFHSLMSATMNQKEIPIATVILELRLAEQRTINTFLSYEEAQARAELASKIIPANGLPPGKMRS